MQLRAQLYLCINVGKKCTHNFREANLKMHFTTKASICRLLAHFYVVDW
jgi:hypothetical protein